MNPPFVPIVVGVTSVDEFGFRTEIPAEQHVGPIRKLIR